MDNNMHDEKILVDYSKLRAVLEDAYMQAAYGKGKERHANGKPFTEQPLFEISRMVGLGGATYQIMKKAQEAQGMADRGQLLDARHELGGVIVYAAAMSILIQEEIDEYNKDINVPSQAVSGAR